MQSQLSRYYANKTKAIKEAGKEKEVKVVTEKEETMLSKYYRLKTAEINKEEEVKVFEEKEETMLSKYYRLKSEAIAKNNK